MTHPRNEAADEMAARRQRLDATLTVGQFVRTLAEEFGPRTAIAYGDDGLTYGSLEECSCARAVGLLRQGVGKGDTVGIRFGNNPDWVIWWAAISRIGAICVPLSTFLKPPELARVVRHADLHGLVTTSRFLGNDFIEHLNLAFPELSDVSGPELMLVDAPFLRWVVADGAADASWVRPTDWLESSSGQAGEALLAAAERQVHPDDETIIIYTSGQSAEPKGVVHTHRSVMTKIHYLREMLGFDEATRAEASMPFFWVGGLVMTLFTAMDAGGVVICDRERTTYGIGQVIGSSAKQADPYPNLRSAPALGMTETFGMYSWGDQWRVAGHELAAPLDRFQPGFEVRLVDQEGVSVADGERGQIIVRGPSVATRLHKVERITCFDANGFYQTGDEGQRDGDRIHFTGRLGDMIKTSGANVSPAEVEQEICALDGVTRAHVVAVVDSVRDQVVAAAVVADPLSGLTPRSVRTALRERLSPYKVPRKIVVFTSADQIPMTPTMKVNKPALAQLLADTDDVMDD